MRREILLVATDPGARDFVLRHLGRHWVTIAASPPEAAILLAARRYGLVLVTNFGVRPDEALAAIPARRDYPVLFLTGHVTDRIERSCVEKSIPMLRIPKAIDMLRSEIRLVLEDLRICGARYCRALIWGPVYRILARDAARDRGSPGEIDR